MRKVLLACLLLVGLAWAAPVTYTVNDARNQMTWEGHAHGETVHGHTNQVKGQMVGNPQDITDNPQIAIEADLASLSSTVGSEAWNSRDLKSRPH